MLEAIESREAASSVSLRVHSRKEIKIHTITGFVIQLRALDFNLRAMQSLQGNYKIRCTSWMDCSGCSVKNGLVRGRSGGRETRWEDLW